MSSSLRRTIYPVKYVLSSLMRLIHRNLVHHVQGAATRQRKLKQAKVSRDFQTSILSYQTAAKQSAERQRIHVARARAAIDQGDAEQAEQALSPSATGGYQLQQQQVLQTDLVPDSELEYQEQLIQEREGEIEDIERGVLELNEIFRDLGTIVTEQQSMLGQWKSPLHHPETAC